jgi:hypothetical protein
VGSLTGDREADQADIQKAKTESTDARLMLEESAKSWIEKTRGSDEPGKRAALEQLRENEKLLDAVLDEVDSQTKGLNSPERQAKHLPVEDGTRARWVLNHISRLPAEKRMDEIRQLAHKGIVTEKVLDQLLESASVGKN